jgi:hypothetical protein
MTLRALSLSKRHRLVRPVRPPKPAQDVVEAGPHSDLSSLFAVWLMGSDDQGVAGMKLPKINECNGQLVLMHDARRNLGRGDVAEDAAIVACAHWSNENKISDAYREPALTGGRMA